jgi:hypothetical protein
MNVQLPSIEAAQIERGTGQRARFLANTVTHVNAKFAGVSCPFLHNAVLDL